VNGPVVFPGGIPKSLAKQLFVVIRRDVSSMFSASLVQQSDEIIQVQAAVILSRTVLAFTADAPAAPELDRPLGNKLKAS
jgi:hypothetical protein